MPLPVSSPSIPQLHVCCLDGRPAAAAPTTRCLRPTRPGHRHTCTQVPPPQELVSVAGSIFSESPSAYVTLKLPPAEGATSPRNTPALNLRSIGSTNGSGRAVAWRKTLACHSVGPLPWHGRIGSGVRPCVGRVLAPSFHAWRNAVRLFATARPHLLWGRAWRKWAMAGYWAGFAPFLA